MGVLWRWTSLFLVVIWAQQIVGPPAAIKKPPANHTVPDHPDNQEKPEDDLETKYNLEYNRYLKEVVDALESDPEFRRKLETAEEVDFRNGKVAAELEYVNHHVRTKLDELKRTELSRLRELLKMEEERKRKEEDPSHHGHLDDSNPHTFEVQDLQMLMNKVRYDLEKADEQRRAEFKEYEMQKEFEKEQKLKTMDEEHKKEYLKQLEEEKKQQQQHHEPVHHPGSKAQLEEVWEKTDHMSQQFDPKAFFYLHDLDGNGYWDEAEVNALFIKELDKIYAQAGPNNHIDMREREEEMERMREHVFKETDTNRDRFISFDEFLAQTKRDEWRRDEGWQSIDQRPQFTQAEYEEFERRRQEEIQRLIEQGALPMHPAGMQPPYQYVHPNQIPQGQHPNMAYQPVHGPGAPMNQAQYAVPQYQAHPGAGQQQYQQHPGAGQPQYQAHPGAAAPGQPQYQAHPAAAAPGQPQYQAHPAAGQQQYQAHPAAGQPQYQAHPAAGQPQYQAHPAAGQPQYQAHPAAAQPQYQAHPGAVQPQYQTHPAAAQPQAHPSAQQFQQAPPQHYQQPAGQPQYQAAQPNLSPPDGKPEPAQAAQHGGQPQAAVNPPAAPSQAHPAPPQQNHPAPPQQYNSIPDNPKINEIPNR